MKWFDERHYTIHVASDSSSFRWGGVLLRDRTLAPIEVGDFWEPVMLSKSIEIKEIVALSRTLLALRQNVQKFQSRCSSGQQDSVRYLGEATLSLSPCPSGSKRAFLDDSGT